MEPASTRWTDPLGSHLAALTLAEREHLHLANALHPSEAADVNSDPQRRDVHTLTMPGGSRQLQTLMKGNGLIVFPSI